jgi:anti-sigma factor (TIGR02949 family)
MISCDEAVRQLWDYLDRTLSPADLVAVEGHLAFCRRCCGEVEFARELRSFLASRAAGGVPADVRSRLERFIDDLTTGSQMR